MAASTRVRGRKDTAYFTMHTPVDELGRRMFTIEWYDKDFRDGPSWRGQVFHTEPENYVKTFTATGRRVAIVEALER
jgi:hypothetical protein